MDATSWLKSLVEPVIVVGNGPLSRAVDESEGGSVIRFNNFELNAISGWKTTHWVTCAWTGVKDRPILTPFSPWTARCASAKRGREFFSVTGKTPIYTPNNNHVLKWFPMAYYQPWNNWPSTGFCLLSFLDCHGIIPTIYGFNGLKNGHYWNPSHQHDHQLTARREISIINKYFIKT